MANSSLDRLSQALFSRGKDAVNSARQKLQQLELAKISASRNLNPGVVGENLLNAGINIGNKTKSLINSGIKTATTPFTTPIGPAQISIYDAAKKSLPGLGARMGRDARSANLGIFSEIAANTLEGPSTGAENVITGIGDVYSGKPIQGTFRAIKGIGQVATGLRPSTQIANLASNVGPDVTRRYATGYLRGSMINENLSPTTKENKWLNIPLIGQVDPAMMIGQMSGFTKNEANKKLYSITTKLFPTVKSSVSKWFVSTAIRGGVENLIQTFDGMPTDRKEAVKYLTGKILEGAASEVVGQAIGEGISAAGKSKAAKYTAEKLYSVYEYLNKPDLGKIPTELNQDGYNLKGAPLWKAKLMDLNFELKKLFPKMGLGIEEITPEERVKLKNRGLVESVKEAENVLPEVKSKVFGQYEQKPNAELMKEARVLLTEGASLDLKNIKGADKKVAATIQEAINLQSKGDYQSAANLYNNLSEAGTEGGRMIQAFSLLKKMSPESIALSIAGKIKKFNSTHKTQIPELTGEQMKLVSKKINEMDMLPEGRLKNIATKELEDLVNSFIPSSIGDKFIAVWKAGLLTSLRTHERNIVGNTLMSSAEIAKDPIAATVDRILSLRTGQRSTSFTLQGALSGGKMGVQSAKDMVLYGYDPEESIAKLDFKKINWGKNKFEQGLKKFTDAVFNTLGAEDKVFYKSAYLRSMYDQAITTATNAGKTGNKNFVKNLVDNPTEEMINTAINEANYATFHDTNVINAAINSFKRSLGDKWYLKVPAEIITPFTGVPTSIAGKMIDYSPIGLIKGAVKGGRVLVQNIPELQRQASQEIARGMMGSGLMALGAFLYNKGLLTGQPKDTEEADLWKAQNKQANSVLIGGKWRSINSVGPQALVLLAGAKAAEEANKEDGSFGAFAGGVGKDFTNQTFLAGVQAPLQAITEPQRYGTSYIGNQLSTLIPNISKDVARAFDPKARETATVSDYLKYGIPGLRNTLVEKRDVLGDVVPQEPTGIAAMTDLFNSKTPKDSLILSELSRLNDVGNPATPSRQTANQTILKQKVKLTVDQLNNLEAGSGAMVKQSLSRLITANGYKNLTDEQKSQAITNAIQDARRVYKTKYGASILEGASVTNDQINDAKSIGSDTYVFSDSEGNLREINVGPMKFPKITGQDEFDTIRISRFKTSLNKRKNDVMDLLDANQISEEVASKQIKAINTILDYYSKLTKTAKKLKSSGGGRSTKTKVKSIPTAKIPTIKLQSAKISKAKLPKIKAPKV